MKAYLQRNDNNDDKKCSKKGTVLVIDDLLVKVELMELVTPTYPKETTRTLRVTRTSMLIETFLVSFSPLLCMISIFVLLESVV